MQDNRHIHVYVFKLFCLSRSTSGYVPEIIKTQTNEQPNKKNPYLHESLKTEKYIKHQNVAEW